MEWTDEGTFSLTFKTDNQGYEHVKSWVESHMELISARILPDTKNMINNDPAFKKLVSISKKANDAKLDYINNHNYKHK